MESRTIEAQHGAYEISTDPIRVDRAVVHEFLSTDAYWAQGRSRELVDVSIENSGLVCGAYTADGSLVGFARMVTDFATFAWLCDVFVLREHRGEGLGVVVVTTLVEHPRASQVKRQLLATRDAHSLYESLGFTQLETPSKWMEKRQSPS